MDDTRRPASDPSEADLESLTKALEHADPADAPDLAEELADHLVERLDGSSAGRRSEEAPS